MQFIPWTSHPAVIPIFLLTYYALVITLCFSQDFVALFHKSAHRNNDFVSECDVQYQLQAAVDEIRAYLDQAAYYTLAKAELSFGLQRVLSKYKNLQNTSYETSINQLVLEECVCCNVQLSKEEVDQLWGVWVEQPSSLSP